MAVCDAHKRNLRLPRELAARLKKEAGAQGISENDYLIIALTGKLDADEARRRQQASEAPRRKRDHDAPRGLGLRLAPLSPADPMPAAEPAAPVVVNVGTKEGAAEGGDLIAGLAGYVMGGGPAFERERRQRTAVDILRAHGKTSDERGGLVRQLDQALAARKTQRPALTSVGDIGSLFR